MQSNQSRHDLFEAISEHWFLMIGYLFAAALGAGWSLVLCSLVPAFAPSWLIALAGGAIGAFIMRSRMNR